MLAEHAVALYSPFKATFAPKKACQRPCKRVRTRKSSSGWGMDDPNFTGNDPAVGNTCFEVLRVQGERDPSAAGNSAQ